MLDMKWVRDHYDEVAEMLASRNNAFPLDRYKELDEERRKTLLRVEALKEKRNSGSKEVAVKKKAGEDTSALQNEIRAAGERHARPLVFIQDGRRAALREAAAHDHGHIIGPGQAAGFGKLIFVSFVKRIIFRDDPCDGHGRRSPFCVSFSAVSGFIIA